MSVGRAGLVQWSPRPRRPALWWRSRDRLRRAGPVRTQLGPRRSSRDPQRAIRGLARLATRAEMTGERGQEDDSIEAVVDRTDPVTFEPATATSRGRPPDFTWCWASRPRTAGARLARKGAGASEFVATKLDEPVLAGRRNVASGMSNAAARTLAAGIGPIPVTPRGVLGRREVERRGRYRSTPTRATAVWSPLCIEDRYSRRVVAEVVGASARVGRAGFEGRGALMPSTRCAVVARRGTRPVEGVVVPLWSLRADVERGRFPGVGSAITANPTLLRRPWSTPGRSEPAFALPAEE
jgi:hypothetical protein